MRYRAALADALSLGNGASGVAGVMVMLAWHDPRALAVACVFVFIGWGFDSVDGFAARGVQRSPAEGAVLDSLCDTSSFGALPAALLTAYGLRGDRSMLIVSVVAGVVFYGCAILRLRRYTVGAVGSRVGRTDVVRRPAVAGGGDVSGRRHPGGDRAGPPALAWMPILFAAVAAPLMMSRIPYQETPRVAVWMVRAKWPLPVLAAVGYAAGQHRRGPVGVLRRVYRQRRPVAPQDRTR